MKHKRTAAAAMLTLLLPAAPVMAHAEATAGSGILALAHQLVHILQASPLLQALIASAVIAAFAIFRINKRES
jgi:hypothetical protein